MEDVERLVEDCLNAVPGYIWDGEMLAVLIEEIADSYVGLLARNVDDMSAVPGAPRLQAGQSLSGLLLSVRAEISVDAGEAREWPTRRRFTLAHELGLWRLHREIEKGVFCRATAIDPRSSADRPPLPAPEEEANASGAALLMPARLLKRECVRCERDFFGPCEPFGASRAAMGRRLHAVIKPDSAG